MTNYKKGDLIKWYESYADDLSMIKDTGIGVFLKSLVHEFQDHSYTTVTVYRNKFNDIISLPECNVEILSCITTKGDKNATF